MVNRANESARLITAAKKINLLKLKAKLADPNAGLKTYYSILKRFLSKKNKIFDKS